MNVRNVRRVMCCFSWQPCVRIDLLRRVHFACNVSQHHRSHPRPMALSFCSRDLSNSFQGTMTTTAVTSQWWLVSLENWKDLSLTYLPVKPWLLWIEGPWTINATSNDFLWRCKSVMKVKANRSRPISKLSQLQSARWFLSGLLNVGVCVWKNFRRIFQMASGDSTRTNLAIFEINILQGHIVRPDVFVWKKPSFFAT